MPTALATDAVRQYERDGIYFPVDALSAADAARSLDAFLDLERRQGGGAGAPQLAQAHLHFRWAYDLATHPRVLDAVESVLGPDIMIWTSQFFAKREADPGFVSWHQDGTYWGLDSTKVTTAWIALTDSRPDNGCMRVVAGSHAQRILPHRDTFAKDNLLSRGQEVAVEVAEADATDVVLEAGQLSLHHVNIIHGSNPNPSARRRIGFAVRFMAPEVKQVGDRQPVVLARGRDDFHHFEVLAAPPSGTVEEGIAAQAESARRLREALLKTTAAQ